MRTKITAAAIAAGAAIAMLAAPSASAEGHHHGRELVTTCHVRKHHASGTIVNRSDHLSRWFTYSLTTYGPKGGRLWTFKVADRFELGAGQVMSTNDYRIHRAVSCKVRLGH